MDQSPAFGARQESFHISSLNDLRDAQARSAFLASRIPSDRVHSIVVRYRRALERSRALVDGRRDAFYTP